MSRREEQAEPRRPHTFYLTDQLWEDLERRYLEERLAGTAETKIGFVESVLRSGLMTPGSASSTQRRGSDTTRRQPPSTPAKVETPAEATPDDDGPTTSAPDRPPASAAVGASDAPTRQTVPPRQPRPAKSGALARLRDASDPGRPPTITSAAPVQARSDHPDEGMTGS